MDEVEKEIIKGISEIEEKIERLKTLDQIMERIVEISKYKINTLNTEDLEEYYIEQINRWMAFGEEKMHEIEKKEDFSREQEKKYLTSLKKIKELEKINEDTKSKYEYYKTKQTLS